MHERPGRVSLRCHTSPTHGRPDRITADRIRVCVLDTVSVAPSGRTAVPIGSLQRKQMLTLLVGYGPRGVSLDRIAEELWGEHPPPRWVPGIRTLAVTLRRLAADRDLVHWTGRGYRLHKDMTKVETDVDEMLQAASDARDALVHHRFDEAEAAARAALEAYGSGPWTTDYWHWGDVAAECYHLLGRALLGRRRHLSCLVELSRAPEDLEWHAGLRSCLADARTTGTMP